MKKIVLVLTLALGLFTLAACGNGNDDDTNEDEGFDFDYVQGVTDTTITVGNAAATSGAFAEVGVPFNAGITSYFEMINDEGGIGGRTLEFIHYDDEFDAELGYNFVQTLVEDDEVFALVGHFGTPTVGATIEYLDNIGIPRVYYATGISDLFLLDAEDGEQTSFPVQPIYDAEGEVMVARAVAEFDAEKIGVIYTNDDAGIGMFNGIEIRAELLNVELVTRQVDAGDIDMASAASALVNEGVDAVIVAMNQAPAKIALQDLVSANNTAPAITSYVNANATFLADIPGVTADNAPFDLYASAWINIFDAEGQGGFSDAYWLFAGTVPAEYAANAYAMAGWIAAHFFVEGLKRVGDGELTWETFLTAMEEAPISIPFGGIVDYADGRRVGTQAMAFLKAEQIAGEEVTFNWATIREIEDIESILE